MTVLTLAGNPIKWFDPPEATALVTWSEKDMYGRTVKGSLRTIAHLDRLNNLAKGKYGQGIVIIQPPYNTTVAASAGTHDYDCCVDLYIPGVGWWEQQRFFRANGLGCWYRHPPLFGNHIHGFTLPVGRTFATRVGIYVPGQLVDYYAEAFGLANQHTPGSDNSWFPANKDATIFDLGAYIKRQQEENDMTPEQDKMLRQVHRMVTNQGKRDTERFQTLREKSTQADKDLAELLDLVATSGQMDRLSGKVTSVQKLLRDLTAALPEEESVEPDPEGVTTP